jgi:hypothetical protein
VWLSFESREKAFPPHALSRWDRVASHSNVPNSTIVYCVGIHHDVVEIRGMSGELNVFF